MRVNKIICSDKSWYIFHFKTLNSTMEEIKKNTYTKYDNLVIYSDSQREGKGRNNNKWVSERGNLYVSFKLTKLTLKQFFILNYIIGLTVHEVIKSFLGVFKKLYIKWPNDIILDNKKLAGNIIELFSIGKKIDSVFVGVGINIAHSPNNLEYLTTFLNAHTEKKVSIIEIIKLMLEEFSFWENNYNINFIISMILTLTL